MKKTLLALCLLLAHLADAQFTFTKKADFPGGTRFKMLTQMLGTKLYCGLGQDSTGAMHKDVWAYETTTNTWTHKADMPVSLRRNVISCSIGGKMYAGFGY